jgi:hypothetical protein
MHYLPTKPGSIRHPSYNSGSIRRSSYKLQNCTFLLTIYTLGQAPLAVYIAYNSTTHLYERFAY